MQLGQAVLPPGAAAALRVDDRGDQRRRVALGVAGLLPGDGGDLQPEGVLEVVAFQGAAQPPALRAAAGEGAQQRLVEIRPDQHGLVEQAVGADHRARRGSRGVPAGFEHPVIVGELHQVGPAADDPQGLPGQHGRGCWGRLAERGVADGRRLVVDLDRRAWGFADLVPLDLDRVVAGRTVDAVRTANQQVGPAHPMTRTVDRQQSADDHLRAGGHRPHAGLGLPGRLVRPEQSQIDHLAAAAGDQLLHDHGLELLSAVEELGQAVDGFAGGERDRGVVRVVGLDRAAARRVRVEQNVLAVMGGGPLELPRS